MLVEFAVQLDFGREHGGRRTELVDDLDAGLFMRVELASRDVEPLEFHHDAEAFRNN
jgi:hypothetical protein